MGKKKSKTPVVVTITKTKHATQPWKVVVDDPGPGPKLAIKERYCREFTAKRGAVRKLGGYTQRGYDAKNGRYYTIAHFTQEGREITFVTKRPK